MATTSAEYYHDNAAPPSPGLPQRDQSPVSPGREIRMREKKDITGLNSRLAHYIDIVRRLQNENETLRIKITRSEDITKLETNAVRECFEVEVTSLRQDNETLVADKATLETQNAQLQSTLNDLAPRVLDLEQKNDAAMLKKAHLQKQVDDLKATLTAAERERDLMAEAVANQMDELEDLKRQLRSCRDQLEIETGRRVEAETALDSFKKRVNFEKNIFDQTMGETSTIKITEIEEIQRRKDTEANTRIEMLLEEMRAQHEDKIQDYKQEKEEFYNTKIRDMKDANLARDRELFNLRKNFDETQSDNNKLMNEIMDLKDFLKNRDDKINDLEKKLLGDKIKAADKENDMNNELTMLTDTLRQQMDEYQALLDEKLTLDLEIAAYRKMIESEEERMNITPTSGEKRKSTGDDHDESSKTKRLKLKTEESFRSETVQSTKSAGLELVDTDPQGHYVTIQNRTNQELSLFNYQLVQVTADMTCNYVFPDGFTISPNATLTIYGNASPSAVQNYPHSIIAEMIEFWPVGEQFYTGLYDETGEEVSKRECKRTVTEEDNFHLEDFPNREKCVIS